MAEYRGSITAKITASIIWVFIFFGIVVTTVALLTMRDNLQRDFARDARHLIMLVERQAALAGNSAALKQQIRTELLPQFSFPKVEIEIDGSKPETLYYREGTGNIELIETQALQVIRYRDTENLSRTLKLRLFHPPFHQIINGRRTEIIMTFILPLLGIAALLFLITHRVVTYPLLRVVDAIGKVANGDMRQRVLIERNDELGTLATFFNNMLDELNKKQNALKYEIRKRSKAQKELIQYSEELRLTNHELSTFSYTVSHDLRAPLRAIHGFSDALVDDHGDELSDDARDLVMRISKAGRKMDRLIGDILDLSRLSRQEIDLRAVDLDKITEETFHQLKNSHPDCVYDLKIETPLKATADPSLMHIVLENLLSNACKYSSKTARPIIEVGRAPDKDNQDCFFVRDNGSGFDMKKAKKLFLPFQRLHQATEFEGTGVGLATVKRIIEKHHGLVWATSKPGDGACFYFSLPRQPQPD